MTSVIKKYEDLEFTDNFMFVKIMYNNPDLCQELLELILGRKISKIVFKDYEKTIEIRPDSKGIRLDVYTMDEEQRVYDIDMQVDNYENLPHRTRYYHSMIDLELLEKGKDYSQINDSYVIFICKDRPAEDYVNPVYTFRYQSVEKPQKYLEDGTWTVIVNAGCDTKKLSPDLRDFLNFVHSGAPSTDPDSLAAKLADAVSKARQNRIWRADYMTYEQEMKHQFFLGKEEGRAEGLKEGLEKGLEKGRAEERARADVAESRADAAEREVALLKEQLAKLTQQK